MAFSITSQKHQYLPLGELTREQFLVLAIEAAERSDWSIGRTTENGFSAFTGISLSSYSEEVSVYIQEDTALVKSECIGTQLFDWGKNSRNLRNFTAVFEDVKHKFTPEELQERYKLIREDENFVDNSEAGEAIAVTPSNFFSLFIPAKGYFITPILVNLNLLVFLIMAIAGVSVFEPDSVTLISWGANYHAQTLGGAWWRLISCCFLHIGFWHLLMNMYALIYIGSVLEPLLGRSRFLLAYLATGIAGSLLSVYWHPLIVSAGASGAIFGMYGVFLALLSSNYLERTARKAFLTSIGIFVGYNLLNGISGNTDNAAHIGGLVAGIILGFAFLPALKYYNDRNLRLTTFWATAGIFLVLSVGTYWAMPNVIKEYEQKMEQFKTMELLALEVYNLTERATKEEIQDEITKRGFYYWNENLKILNELDQLRLPDALVERNKIMRQYVELNIQNYELIFKMVAENDPQHYRPLIEQNLAKISGLHQYFR